MNNGSDTQLQGHVDVAVIGAGPAGMAAATVCAEHGLNVAILDDQATPGGQIYRGITLASRKMREVLGPDYCAGDALVAPLLDGRINYMPDTAVWEVTRDKTLHLTQGGRSSSLQADYVVLSTGAMERPFPIPGWTLPGVMTAGAAQILLKTAGATAMGPVILAGCGPLLYLLAAQYLAAGTQIAAVVDTTGWSDYWRALQDGRGAASDISSLAKGLKLLRTIKKAGVPFFTNASNLEATGDDRVREFKFTSGGKVHCLAANVLLLHHGVVPNTQFTWSLRAPHEWSEQQLCWLPKTNAVGELDGASGIFVAGDGAAIIGAQAAAQHGRLIGIEISGRAGRLSAGARDEEVSRLNRRLNKTRQFRRFLDALYRPKAAHRVPADDVIVCRCEEVTAGALRNHVALGCLGPNQAKSFSRCGMGPCQGRQCGLTVTELIATVRGVEPATVGYFRVRPPVKQVTLGELAEE
ncbi:MAG TPA: NAD(P)/FAD-dependent oxidoreductase [Burkholderiaceae bacterium]|nr:NAD(P)/FAD-dependent oxidoreductase [Burkholderiaceae bacterium]